MIVVIQCAASKMPHAGCLRRGDGRNVLFVADPANAPADRRYVHAHPDGMADTGRSWREELRRYNDAPGDNPLGLLPAWQLYENATYRRLADHCGTDRLYILSAGWGLIGADFLTPKYDITFSAQANRYKRRRNGDRYDDFRMLPTEIDEPMALVVSSGYASLACELTRGHRGPRYLFYNAGEAPRAPGCIPKKYETRRRRNWQYECADALIDGKIGAGSI